MIITEFEAALLTKLNTNTRKRQFFKENILYIYIRDIYKGINNRELISREFKERIR